jgi:hypothetical protein
MINTDIEKLEEQYNTITIQIKTLNYRIQELEEEKKKITDKILKIKQELELPKLLEEVKKIDNDNILTIEEIKKIYQGMDKSDYSDVGIKHWIDLKKLVNTIINVKNRYKLINLVLLKVVKGRSVDIYPPKNYYSLKFKDKDYDDIYFEKEC